MTTIQVSKPKNWQDLQDLCVEIYGPEINDNQITKYGRQGSEQKGVDIVGIRNRNSGRNDGYIGIQCKHLDELANKSELTEQEVLDEVEKAKSFEPKLTEYIISTTDKTRTTLQSLILKINEQHRKQKLFTVAIESWDDLSQKINSNPDLISKYCGGLTTMSLINKSLDKTTKTITKEIKQLGDQVDSKNTYKENMRLAKDFINSNNPSAAVKVLNRINEEFGSNLEPKEKYDLLASLGVAYIKLGQDTKASRLFLEAFQYNSEDDKALSWKAYAHLHFKEYKEAVDWATKSITKNPTNTSAYSTLIQASRYLGIVEETISQIPAYNKIKPEVALAISHTFFKLNDLEKAEQYANKGIENSDKKEPELLTQVGLINLHKVTSDPLVKSGERITPQQMKQLELAVSSFTEAWEAIQEPDIRRSQVNIIVHRGVAKRTMGKNSDAVSDFEIAFDIAPDDIYATYHKAFSDLQNSVVDEKVKVSMLKNIESKELPQIPIVFATMCEIENKLKEGTEGLEKVITNYPNHPLILDLNEQLAYLYIKSGEIEKAITFLKELQQKYPDNLMYKIREVQVSFENSKIDKGVYKYNLGLIKDQVDKNATYREILTLADEYYSLEQYFEASEMYEKIADINSVSPMTRKLLACYSQSNQLEKARELCKHLRSKNGAIDGITHNEIGLHFNAKDFKSGIDACNSLLEKDPSDLEARINLAILNYHIGKEDFLKDIVSIDLSKISNLSPEILCKLSDLYREAQEGFKSISIIYETRRLNPKDKEVNKTYVKNYLFSASSSKIDFSVKTVQPDVAIQIEWESGNKNWYVIEEREQVVEPINEINLSHPLYLVARGKTIGDSVEISTKYTSVQKGKILDIKSKYFHACYQCVDYLQVNFPDDPGFALMSTKNKSPDEVMYDLGRVTKIMSEDMKDPSSDIGEN